MVCSMSGTLLLGFPGVATAGRGGHEMLGGALANVSLSGSHKVP